MNSNATEFKEPPAEAQQTGNLLVPSAHHEVKSVTIGGPLLNFGGQQNLPQPFDRQPKTSTRSANHAIAFASTEAPRAVRTEFVSTTRIERPQPVEMPVLPTLQVARRISIEVGDDDSRVRITLHERSGDVSVKFDTATNELRSNLQSSAGTLIEAFRREDVPLADLAFTNTLGNTESNGQHERRQHARAFRRRPAMEELAISEIEVNQSGNRINIHA
jgi:hypothetical protein